MLQHHLEFEIVTPRTLKDFKGEILVLSDVRCISGEELDLIEAYLKAGNALIATDQSGKYDETGMKSRTNRLKKMMKETFGSNNATSLREDQFHYYQIGPGIKYTEYCRRSFNHYAWSGDYTKSEFWKRKDELLSNLRTKFKYQPVIRIEASPYLSTQIAEVDSKLSVFMANFRGLKGDEVATQIPEENVKISFPADSGTKIFFLPFLGEKVQLQTSKENDQLICVLPPINKGGVVWLE